MTTTMKWGLIVGGICAAALLYVGIASANPSFLIESNASATTTIAYINAAGTATSTSSWDSQIGGAVNKPDSARLLVYFTASSTNTTLNWFYEYSQDNISWYRDNISLDATTSPAYAAQVGNSFSWVYASTTVGALATSANSNTGAKIFTVPTPTRYVRAVFSLPPSSTNGGVSANFVGQYQNR